MGGNRLYCGAKHIKTIWENCVNGPDSSDDTRGHSALYAGYVLALLVVINTLSYADRFVFSILIPDIKKAFGTSDSVLGLLGGPAFMISFVLFTLPLARLGDRWSRRGVVSIAAVVWSLASAACGVVTNIVQMSIARVLVGVGEAGATPSSQAMVSSLFSEKRRSTAMGVLAAASQLGVLTGLAGGAAIAAHWGWQTAFIALSLPGVFFGILIWLTGPKQVRHVSTAAASEISTMQVVKHFLATPSLRYIALGVGVFNIFGYAGITWLPAYFIRSHGLTVVETGTWLGVGSAIGGVLGAISGGMLVDRLRHRNEAWQLRVPAIGLFASVPLLAIMFLLPGGMKLHFAGLHIPVVALLLLTTAFLGALWTAPAYGAIARLIPVAQRAQAVGVFVVILNLIGSVLGPPIAGLASDFLTPMFAHDAMRYSLLAMTVLVFAGAVLAAMSARSFTADLARAHGG